LTQFSSVTEPVWLLDSLVLPNPSATYQIAFEFRCGYGYGAGLDDIKVYGEVLSCPPVTNLNATPATISAQISWTSNGTAWELEYRTPPSTGTWVAATGTIASPYSLGGLTANTEYEVRVRNVCSTDDKSTWVTTPFTTLVIPCNPPTNIDTSNVSTNLATITWSSEPNVTQWEVEYKLQTASEWAAKSTTYTPTFTFVNLIEDTTYCTRIQSICGEGVQSDYSGVFCFRTKTTGIVSHPDKDKITIYPNPTTGELRITNYELRDNSTIEVYDVLGRKQKAEGKFPSNLEGSGEVDISHLPAGIYFLRITTDYGVTTKKVVKKNL